MVDRKPPEYYMTVALTDGTLHRFALKDVLALLKADGGGTAPVQEIRVGMERDGIMLHADFQPREADYPGITVDASTPQAGNIYLGNFELPCETYPTRIAARLYAGCEKYETDEPIAVVTHEATDDARVIYRSQNHPAPDRAMRKLVYVDEKSAKSTPWLDAGEENMPEHVEDML